MSRNIRVTESSAEMQIKIIRAKDAIASQKPRTVRCPYCRHNSIIVFEDTRGHVQTKCKACGRETVFNVLEMRRLRTELWDTPCSVLSAQDFFFTVMRLLFDLLLVRFCTGCAEGETYVF